MPLAELLAGSRLAETVAGAVGRLSDADDLSDRFFELVEKEEGPRLAAGAFDLLETPTLPTL
ncbi:hypothetical protein [Streptomyces sp. NPDC050759]|uniref:hypothetical protein n=1 Tax=Streptomyces sp. NPDC050759 TaxID=3365635 RepID=UPI003798967D